MKKNNEFSLDNYSKGITPEPPTYSILLEKKKQSNLMGSDLNDIKLNSQNSDIIAYTSGLGGLFKPGIPIGKISNNTGKINFFSDFSQLSYVKILSYKVGEEK